MIIFFAYSMGIFLGIQIGKQMNPNYQYILNKYSRLDKLNKSNINYYKNHQMDYRLNR